MADPNINITATYPLELHYIKALFLQKKYRHCIQTCRDVLKAAACRHVEGHPLQQTFISFYLGLAHDELARLMHDYSQAKIPAFSQAELFYKAALQSLPAPDRPLRASNGPAAGQEEDPFVEPSPRPLTAQRDDEYDHFNYSSFPSNPPLSPMSPPTHIRTDSLPVRSPPSNSRETSLSDLESHASFEQIMTPHKVLQRDISRMSLLDDIPAPPLRQSLPRSNTSQGLMRPIRPGSPPKAFHVPPRLPYARSAASTSRLPKLATRGMPESPSKRVPSAIAEEWEDPTPPVSPLGSDGVGSDGSTISPISPDTPVRESGFISSAKRTAQQEEEERLSRMTEHLLAMRAQLETHLRLLESAKTSTTATLAARAGERALAAPTKGTPLAPVRASLDGSVSNGSRPGSVSSRHDSVLGESKRLPQGGEGKNQQQIRLPQARSYWSFTPEDVKAAELRKRVEAGRERGWVRGRFRPERYVELAERAMAEL